ncbi:Metalloenzyme, LuxS/M16 peptidase-like protein [Cladochytrium replicatum]|nr:Metalloenzyme, LuxS/M16 peptidase-like protein [Cladochytrium replicatum]
MSSRFLRITKRSYATPSTVSYTRKGNQAPVAPLALKTVSKLTSGIQVATVDDRGPVSTLGLVFNAGSRFESIENLGAAHFLKNVLIRNIPDDVITRTVRETELRGNTLSTTVTRENVAIFTDFLRDDLVDAVPLLVRNLFHDQFFSHEFLDAEPFVVAETEASLADPSTQVVEALHKTAFRTGLGNSLFCSANDAHSLTRAKLLSFLSQRLVASNVTLVGSGIGHEDFVGLAESAFSDVKLAASATAAAPSKYFGGESRIHSNTHDPAHYVVAFPSVAFTSPQYPAALVFRALLDGGSHVKWGLPGGATGLLSSAATGKTSISAFNSSYSDAGLLGIYARGSNGEIKAVIQSGLEQLKNLAGGKSIAEAQLAKAKKAAIVSLEAGNVTREDKVLELGSSVLATGSVSAATDLASAISKVTASDVLKVAEAAYKAKPTVVAHGNSYKLPYVEDLKF